ncbi:MAG: ABC transporter permease [Sphaerochaetaceae bacterium]|nr:ABC transporter permease [Sphaerochaetaceae bacterium]
MTNRFKTGYKIGVIILAIITAMALGAVILLAIGADVFKTYIVILTRPLMNKIGVTEVLLRMVPLSIIAIGITVAYRSGIINIGAEGQMAIGVLSTTAIALLFPNLPGYVLIPFAILAGAIGGAAWGFIPGFLKAKLQVSELLSTVMLNYIAAQLYTFLLRGPMLDPAEMTMGSGTPQSMRLSKNLDLTRFIKGTRIHTGLFIALALAVIIYFLLWKTSFGFKLRAAGASSKAARYGGINVPKYLIIAMMISGAFAGMAGSIEIAGVHRRAIEGVTSGYGFSGIVVALFGGLHPAGIVPAAFFFGLLIYGADMTQRIVGVPANMVQVLQGIIILVIVSTKMIINNPYLMQKVESRINSFRKKGSAQEETV